MKKIILLLILPLITLMAIDFTMTRDGLIAPSRIDNSSEDVRTTSNATVTTPVTTTSNATVTSGTNPYLEPVNLPECDAGNPEVQFIRSNDDWKNINSSSKHIFCVSPGNYMSLGNITLTRSGTAKKRRYIILNNGNDTHPGKLPTNKLAIFMLRLSGANYWTIDRQSITHRGGKPMNIANGSSYNIINRMYTYNVEYSVNIGHLCHNNTVQNSRFEDGQDPGYDGPVAVQLFAYHVKEAEIHNTKVINNEFYNQNDGFQIVRFAVDNHTTPFQDMNAEGTIVDSNLFHKNIPYMENAIDLKGGSDNPSNPIIISNNIMWGYKQHPDYVPGSYGPGRSAIQAHYSPKNVHILNNIIFDSAEAISSGSNGPKSGFPDALIDGIIENNIFYRCGDPIRANRHIIRLSSNINLTFNNNNYINNQYKEGLTCANTGTFNGNVVVNPYGGSITFEEYGSCSEYSDFKNRINSTSEVSNATLDNFTFTWDKFTNSPQSITLEKVIGPGHEFPKWN